MSVENSWVPVTPIKPPLRIRSPVEEIQQKSDGSTEEEAGKIVACSETSNLVTVDGEKILVVDLNEMKSESISQVLSGELSSKTIPHFVPPTPEKKTTTTTTVELEQVVQVQSSSAGEKRDENGLEQDVCELGLDSSCASVLTPIKCNQNAVIDATVNVTEVTKLKQYRRKHRPKVITEGKPRTSKSVTRRAANSQENLPTKRKYVRKNAVNKPLESTLEPGTLNPVTPEVSGSKGNSTGLRTYIRKRGVNTTETPMEITGASSTNVEVRKRKRRKRGVNTTEAPIERTGASSINVEVQKRKRSRKTCRRSLKFDNEGKQKDESSSCEYSSKVSEFWMHILPAGNYHSHSVVQPRKESEAMFDHRRAGMFYDPNPSMNHQCLPQSQVSNGASQLKPQINHHKDQGGMGKTDSTNHLLSSSKESLCSSTTISTERKQARGIKRKCCHDIKQDYIGSSDLLEEFYNSTYASQMPYAEYFQKEKTDKMQNSGSSSTYFNVTGPAYKLYSLKENPCASKASHWISRPQTRSCLTPGVLGGSVNLNKLQPFDFTKRGCEAQSYLWTSGSWSHHSNMHSKYSPKQPPVITGLENSHRHHPSLGAQFDKMQATVTRKKRTRKSLTSSTSNMDGVEQHPKLTFYCHSRTSQMPPGAPSEINSGLTISTNAMVEEMKILDINREGKISSYEEQNVMVPYNMQNQGNGTLAVYRGVGSVLPFEGSLVPVKKRIRYAKVDLDGETIRVWKLLMGNFNSEVDDGSDEARDKWWEEERGVFSGRANSFIAKMHLIQGDRGFSQWKGSVLDSVIGVFLTQNVSDHLSSSAFMSLAARFPLKPRSLHESSVDDPASFVVTEPDVDLWKAVDSVKWADQISDQPICKQTVRETDQAEEKFPASSESSVSNTAGITPTHENRCSTSSYSSQKTGELEDLLTTEINTVVEACSLGEEKAADAAVSSQMSMISDHSVNSSCSLSTEDRMPCSKSNCGSDPSSEDTSVNVSASSVEITQIVDTTKLRSDSKNISCNDSSDEKSEGTTEIIQTVETTKLKSDSKNISCNDSSDEKSEGTTEIIQILETTKPKSDSKNIRCNDSSDEKSEGTCSTSGEKYVDQRENNDNADCPKSILIESRSHSSHELQKTSISGVTEVECFKMCRKVTPFSYVYKRRDVYDTNEHARTLGSTSQTTVFNTNDVQATRHSRELYNSNQSDQDVIFQSEERFSEVSHGVESQASMSNQNVYQTLPDSLTDSTLDFMRKTEEPDQSKHDHSLSNELNDTRAGTPKSNGKQVKKEKKDDVNWDNLRKQAEANGRRERTTTTTDSLDWEAVRCADVDEIAYTIRERGMNNRLAERIKGFLNRLVKDHGSTDLEWLRDVPPDQVKEYLLSVKGLGLKSVECVRLLTLHQLAFPVDTNVGRIAVRLGWVPLQPLPESLQLHLLELYPVLESIQKYLWPRLCKLDQRTLYELHYQMITFGKVFCTKNKPNCNACPLRGECRHFASAFASARLALPAPEEKSLVIATERKANMNQAEVVDQQLLALTQASESTEKYQQSINQTNVRSGVSNIEPIIEEPATPEPECPEISEHDIEDMDTLCEDPDEIPTIKLNIEAFTKNVQNYIQESMELQEGSTSKALVVLSPEAASIPMPKLKNISRLRTEHLVYELPDSHPLLEKLKMEQRELDDPCFYLLAIWTPGETANSVELPHTQCSSQGSGGLCGEKDCFSCNSVREADSQVVRGTILIPCRTAMRGSFPLNGTYFQVNEVFADHDSSLNPINVPRKWLWNLVRRTVYFGTSIPTIFKGLSTEEIQCCFWRGYVCVRGFDRKTGVPRPLLARLHYPASKLPKTKGKTDKTGKPDDK